MGLQLAEKFTVRGNARFRIWVYGIAKGISLSCRGADPSVGKWKSEQQITHGGRFELYFSVLYLTELG
jgi:hypothetical protein